MSSQKYFSPKYLSREEYVKLPLEKRLIPLSKKEDERAKELQEKLLKIDLHCHGVIEFPYTHLPTMPFSPPAMKEAPIFLDGRIPEPLPKELADFLFALRQFPLETYVKYYKIHWEGLKQAGVTGVQLMVSAAVEDFLKTMYLLGFCFADVQKNPMGKVAYRAEDIRAAKKEGKIAFMAASEANPFANVLDRVTMLYGLGLRQAGMTFEQGNYSGSGNSDQRNTGLSNWGIQIVGKMNELGMIIDLSHSGRNTTMDTIQRSRDPVTLSHNGAKGVYSKGKRCRDDEVLKAMAEKGGIIGITAVPNALSEGKRQGIKDWFDHADYCAKLIGIDHVCVGLDNTWEDHVGFHKMYFRTSDTELPAYYMEGIESPTEAFHNIIRIFVSEGYSDQEIEKIVGANALRFIEKVVG
jgi:microsomal dipeptidase-like Zn-dependent dipeptidase